MSAYLDLWGSVFEHDYGSPMLAARVRSGVLTVGQAMHLVGNHNHSFTPPLDRAQCDLFDGPFQAPRQAPGDDVSD